MNHVYIRNSLFQFKCAFVTEIKKTILIYEFLNDIIPKFSRSGLDERVNQTEPRKFAL